MKNNSFIPRILQNQIENSLFKGKIVILYGARQVGKTTLCRQIMEKIPDSQYINCELDKNQRALGVADDNQLKRFLGDSCLIVLDEAQKIENVGTILKILADTFPETQIIATGSSGFQLANRTAEPLTGRARRFLLYPLSLEEARHHYSALDLDAGLENILRFGMYPGVFGLAEERAGEELDEIASNYLYKDIFQLSGIRKPGLLSDLLRALALQLGSEVSMSELAGLLGKNSHTIESYLDLLEQAFVVFKVRSFSRNLRKEIGKKYKVYFYDTGIRNSLIQNFNPLDSRSDTGALWENFCAVERLKLNNNRRVRANYYFWRTYDGQEIDWVEERAGKLYAFEFKWGKKTPKVPPAWQAAYPESGFQVVTRDNYLDFVL